MKYLPDTIKRYDWVMLLAVFFIVVFSLLTLYSAGMHGDSSSFIKQLVFVSIGISVMFLMSLIDYRIFRNYTLVSIVIFLLAAVLLVAVLFLGKHTRGSVSWFNIGSLKFEPVEVVKLALIIILAKYFSRKHVHIFEMRQLVASAVYFLILAGLVLMQPDLGSAIILGCIWLGAVLVSGMRIKHLAIVLGIGVLLFGMSWALILKPYQKNRIISFISPASDPLGAGYNQRQSVIAIGSSGFFGKGLGRGSQVQLNFLPEKETDFIFAALSEEWGWLGGTLLLSMYGLLAWRIYLLAVNAETNFAKLFSAGYLIMVISSVFINVGMNIGILPITGIGLPFLSYGGSNLLANFVGLGVMQSIKLRTVA